ncbi:hypothetical protein FRC09_000060 [Ceratobasidium sp. 395]|nr:hypothetical protein FRC09_000060 [Ceratobasidium sp. 395]
MSGVPSKDLSPAEEWSNSRKRKGVNALSDLAAWGYCDTEMIARFHRMEVEYLRPGTVLPSSSTISRDIKVIHAKYAPRVREYFQILAAALDNAGNNLTMVRHLQKRIPKFLGEWSYVRCLAHILNLMAKGFMLPYSRPSKRTKQVLVHNSVNAAGKPSIGAVQEFIQAQQLDGTPQNDELEVPDSAEVDEAEFKHDVTLVAQESVVKAIEQLYALSKVAPTKARLQSAQEIMSKLADLARRVGESTALTVKFHEAISFFPALKDTGRKSLSKRVPTRWDSDRHSLDDHIHLQQPVQWLTSQSELKLQRFSLKADQWYLAEGLNKVLEVFEVPTESLETMRDSADISSVTRVGAQAALDIYDKYMNNMSICDVYFVSLVMCPDVKLNWLRKRYESRSVDCIFEMACARFYLANSTMEESKVFAPEKLNAKPRNRWLQPSSVVTTGEPDSIEAYLNSEPVSLVGYGGILPYWSAMLNSTPRLARFALAYLTAPATSVDAERAFSAGRLKINHLQHDMSSQTFEAKMTLGSWYNTPLLPDLEEVALVISETM